jgi:hypothetical protein
MLSHLRALWRELRQSNFRLIPACRIDAMWFVVKGTESNAKRATDRYMKMGEVLVRVLDDLEKHPGSGNRRMQQTETLRDLVRRALQNRL